jgi:hypothetical protein
MNGEKNYRVQYLLIIREANLSNCTTSLLLSTPKNNLFERVLYQYFEGLYYERYHRRNITFSRYNNFIRLWGEREKKNKTYILRVRSKRKKKLLLKKKYGFVEGKLFHLFQKNIISLGTF